VGIYLAEAAAAMSPVIERELMLERSAARERSLVRASERRLGRLAFDLHDGALQHIAAFGADLFLVRRQLTELLPAESQAVGVARKRRDGAKRGRLGLVGSSERIRLLGGRFDVRSQPGGPTTVSLSLPRWRPLGVEQAGDDAAFPALVAE